MEQLLAGSVNLRAEQLVFLSQRNILHHHVVIRGCIEQRGLHVESGEAIGGGDRSEWAHAHVRSERNGVRDELSRIGSPVGVVVLLLIQRIVFGFGLKLLLLVEGSEICLSFGGSCFRCSDGAGSL